MFPYCAFYEQIIAMLNVFVETFMYNLMSESYFHEEKDFEIYTATFLIPISISMVLNKPNKIISSVREAPV